MPPLDSTPLGDEMAERLPEQKFPQPKPGDVGTSLPGKPHNLDVTDVEGGDEADISRRPPLPEHPSTSAVDIEDEEADPVIDSGPGIVNLRG